MARLQYHFEIEVGAALATRPECVIRLRWQVLALPADSGADDSGAAEQDGLALSDTARPRTAPMNSIENSF